ncbi:MAG: TlyA family RNA methyltransferase [Pseudomonadota bacterium]
MPRLDKLLVDTGRFETRSRARDAIARGTVMVNGTPATKAGLAVAKDAQIAVKDPAASYVSRAALKLIAALDQFDFDPGGRTVIDIGASTGGFSQVMLERGASHIFAVDVGSGQLADRLRNDQRITNLENINARHLNITHLKSGQSPLDSPSISAIVSDVSFISLRLALPPALELAQPGAFAALLVKPQFEVGREHIGKGGIVDDPARAEAVASDLESWLETQNGWRTVGLVPSPISGSDGNREFLLGGIKDKV